MFSFLSSKPKSDSSSDGISYRTSESSDGTSAFNRALSFVFSGSSKSNSSSQSDIQGGDELKLNVVSSIGYGFEDDTVASSYFEHPYCEEYLLDGVHWDPSHWIVQSVNRSLTQHVASFAESDGMFAMMQGNAPSVRVDSLSSATHVLRTIREMQIVRSSIVPDVYTIAVMMGKQLPNEVEIKNICIQLMSAIDDASSLNSDSMAYANGYAGTQSSSPEGRVFDIVSMAIDTLIRCLPMTAAIRSGDSSPIGGVGQGRYQSDPSTIEPRLKKVS
jgi:hypothetical protein